MEDMKIASATELEKANKKTRLVICLQNRVNELINAKLEQA